MNILVTTKDTGPTGWNVIPVDDTNVFFDPSKVDEADLYEKVELMRAGNFEPLFEIAEVDI